VKEGTKPGERSKRRDMKLLDKILSRQNMTEAFHRVKSNGGSGGVDGIEAETFQSQVQAEWSAVKLRIENGAYVPDSVRRVEIPKPGGGKRLLGIPTLMDRLIQQGIAQQLVGLYDEGFSDSSYGFRPNRSAHQAVLKAKQYVNEGYTHVVDVDLERFFDRVNHDYLMNLLSARIADKGVLKLIHRYLRAGVLIEGVVQPSTEGTPQGGPGKPYAGQSLPTLLYGRMAKEVLPKLPF
jgi:RNA-directed DNA polymerase